MKDLQGRFESITIAVLVVSNIMRLHSRCRWKILWYNPWSSTLLCKRDVNWRVVLDCWLGIGIALPNCTHEEWCKRYRSHIVPECKWKLDSTVVLQMSKSYLSIVRSSPLTRYWYLEFVLYNAIWFLPFHAHRERVRIPRTSEIRGLDAIFWNTTVVSIVIRQTLVERCG